jgi:hypothetical protein
MLVPCWGDRRDGPAQRPGRISVGGREVDCAAKCRESSSICRSPLLPVTVYGTTHGWCTGVGHCCWLRFCHILYIRPGGLTPADPESAGLSRLEAVVVASPQVASRVFCLLASVEGTTVCLEIPLQSPLGETVTCPPPPRLCPTPPLRYTGCELHLILRYQLLARCSEYPGGACERPSVLFHEGKLCRQNRPIS